MTYRPDEQCPHCSEIALLEDENEATGEISIFCPRCGFFHGLILGSHPDFTTLYVDENGQLQEEGLILKQVLIDKPFGFCEIVFTDKLRNWRCLESVHDLLELLEIYRQDNTLRRIVLRRYVAGRFRRVKLK